MEDKTGPIRNEAPIEIPEQVRRFLDERRAAGEREIEAVRTLAERIQPTAEIRELREHINATILDKLGVRDEVARLGRLMKSHVSAASRLVVDRPLTVRSHLQDYFSPLPSPPTNVGEMWWDNTAPYYDPFTTAIWFENDGVHVAGRYHSSSGDLSKHWVRIRAQYFLDHARLPPANKMYVSNPVAFAGGETYGYCGMPGVIDFGDYWAKCWLNTKHTLFVYPQGLFAPDWPGPTPLIASQSHQLVFLEDGVFDYVPLPGVMAMPLISFYLPQNTHFVFSELEWEFHVQLEGEGSFVNIGHTKNAPSCLIQHPQWTLRPW